MPVVSSPSGAVRPFLLRPLWAGQSQRFPLGAGDLFVIGGTRRHRFGHSVPTLPRPTAPCISITFRHDDYVWREGSA